MLPETGGGRLCRWDQVVSPIGLFVAVSCIDAGNAVVQVDQFGAACGPGTFAPGALPRRRQLSHCARSGETPDLVPDRVGTITVV